MPEPFRDSPSVEVHESTTGKWLHQLGLTRLQPRTFHPKKDAEAQETFKKLCRPGPHCPTRVHRLLNDPMENVWEYLRANKLRNLVWDSYEAIVTACKAAWDFLIQDPDRIRSIGQREWACVKL